MAYYIVGQGSVKVKLKFRLSVVAILKKIFAQRRSDDVTRSVVLDKFSGIKMNKIE